MTSSLTRPDLGRTVTPKKVGEEMTTNKREWWKENNKVISLTDKLQGYDKFVWIWLKIAVAIQCAAVVLWALAMAFGGK